MELVKRKVTIDPGNLPIIAVLVHHLLHRSMEPFAERTLEIGELDNLDGRVRVTENVVVLRDRANIIERLGSGTVEPLVNITAPAMIAPAATIEIGIVMFVFISSYS
jgi:hypothetical protein